MKETIKQLEKEVKKLEKKDLGKEVPLKKEVVEHINLTLEHCKLDTKLQTLKNVCEEIKRKIKEHKDWQEEFPEKDNIHLVSVGCVKTLEELLNKFQGDLK